ncbi:hypothetical protein VTJ04DRAFT_7976 [Mycothermus thermophilus]|uniref:uncharacterized protein n=1 Tax=Humicola insolens TaxID=85995 RepID=UPI003742CBFE
MSFIHSDTEFFKSSYSVGHIIVKPILFVTAQSLMGYFITGLCSLIAAHANQFTAHLMFTENAIQRVLFLKSRRISWPSVLVLFYSILNFFVIIYDSFLWALDNPGAIIPKSHAILSEHLHDLSWDRTYVIPLRLGMGYIYSSDPDTSLAYALGGDLFWPGAGIFITSVVDRGMPSTAEHLQPSLVQQFGPRIWLDETGFSVSCDTSASFPSVVSLPDSNEAFPLTCSDFSNATGRWNCSFPNAFAPYFLERIQGLPEVHWGSSKYSSYVLPNPSDNLWYTAGKGTGTMGMIQVFTITKGKRRHTFVETCFRITMTTRPGVDFDTDDVSDLMLRASSLDEQTISEDLLGMVLHDISAAQQRNESYTFGLAKSRGPYTVLQNSWSYSTGLSPSYTPHVMSVVHITSTNITLLRSEDIPDPPSPHNTNCEEPYHNQAFGGKVTHTSCTKLSPTFEQSNSNPDSDLFTGTIDTSAVTLLQNIGSPTSQTSSGSLNFYSTLDHREGQPTSGSGLDEKCLGKRGTDD